MQSNDVALLLFLTYDVDNTWIDQWTNLYMHISSRYDFREVAF